MKKNIFLFLLIAGSSSAQTFNQIHSIFQANCTVGCHNSTNLQGNLDLSGSVSAVYSAVVNVAPTNPAAKTHGDKLIIPGDPHHSFLLRKCNNNLDADNGIVAVEGGPMPDGATALRPKEIELIRQWVLQGAPQTGNVVDTATINKYYSGKGIAGLKAAPPRPSAPGSFQVHLGKIFLPPTSEAEYFIKHHLNLPDTVEANRFDLKMANQSHHFIIYKFLPGAAASFPEGLRLQNPLTGANSSNGNNTLVQAWQMSMDFELPQGTAYIWEKGSTLDLNYHIHNTNPDSVLAVDVYFDVYTQPKTKPVTVMHSDLISEQNLYIPNDNVNHTFTSTFNIPSDTSTWYVWMLFSHTHKYGKDFDIFLRNSDGTEGQQIFEGWYDTKYQFNQGFYDWQHPPTEMFSPMLPVKIKDGLIQKVTYRNNGSTPVSFGLTTNDEMMLYFIQYTKSQKYLAVNNLESAPEIAIYPNPFSTYLFIKGNSVKEEEIKVEIMDMIGKNVVVPAISKVQGNYTLKVDLQSVNLSQGFYTCKVTQGDKIFVKRLVK